jgi:hypothetical protein
MTGRLPESFLPSGAGTRKGKGSSSGKVFLILLALDASFLLKAVAQIFSGTRKRVRAQNHTRV